MTWYQKVTENASLRNAGRVIYALAFAFVLFVAVLVVLGGGLSKEIITLEPQSVRERISIYAREDSYVVNGKDLIFYSDDRSTQTAILDGATGNLSLAATSTITAGQAVVTGTLTLESAAFSGPVRFGTASSVVSGTTIAHGLAVTPTSVLLTAQGVVTTTPVVLVTDATSITVAFVAGEAQAMTVNWLAGK